MIAPIFFWRLDVPSREHDPLICFESQVQTWLSKVSSDVYSTDIQSAFTCAYGYMIVFLFVCMCVSTSGGVLKGVCVYQLWCAFNLCHTWWWGGILNTMDSCKAWFNRVSCACPYCKALIITTSAIVYITWGVAEWLASRFKHSTFMAHFTLNLRTIWEQLNIKMKLYNLEVIGLLLNQKFHAFRMNYLT